MECRTAGRVTEALAGRSGVRGRVVFQQSVTSPPLAAGWVSAVVGRWAYGSDSWYPAAIRYTVPVAVVEARTVSPGSITHMPFHSAEFRSAAL